MPRRTERDITKLPKWAQERIGSLERHNESLTAKLSHDKLTDQGERSNTFADPYFDAGNPDWDGVPLGRDTTVEYRFDLPANALEARRPDHIHVRLEQGRSEQLLRVYGSDSFDVRPSSSNVVEIVMRDRFAEELAARSRRGE